MASRVTAFVDERGMFQLFLNEEGRDLLVEQLQALNRENDHLHIDHDYNEPDLEGTSDVPLSAVAYHPSDKVFLHGKICLRPDDWDNQHFPHVMKSVHDALETEIPKKHLLSRLKAFFHRQ